MFIVALYLQFIYHKIIPILPNENLVEYFVFVQFFLKRTFCPRSFRQGFIHALCTQIVWHNNYFSVFELMVVIY